MELVSGWELANGQIKRGQKNEKVRKKAYINTKSLSVVLVPITKMANLISLSYCTLSSDYFYFLSLPNMLTVKPETTPFLFTLPQNY